MLTIQEYLEKHRNYYNQEKEVKIWGVNFKENKFSNGDNVIIKDFPNVEFFYLCDINNWALPGGKGIDKIEVHELPKATSIQLYRNDCPEIDFKSTYPNCLYLHVNGNKLKELDLTRFPNLEELDISNNDIEKIDFSPCPKLKIFTCYLNPLTEIKNIPKTLYSLTLSNYITPDMINIDDLGGFVNSFNKKIKLRTKDVEKILQQCGKQLRTLNINELIRIDDDNFMRRKIIPHLDPNKLEELSFSGSINTKILKNFKKLIGESERKKLKKQKQQLQEQLANSPTPEDKANWEKQLRDNQRAISSLESQLNQANSKSTKLAQVAQEKAQLLQELTTLKANQKNFTPQEYQTKLTELEAKLVQVEKEKATALNNLNNSQQARATIFWVIGSCLVIVFLAVLLILVKKRKTKKLK